MLRSLRAEEVGVKIGQVDEWAMALGIEEAKELKRCEALAVLGHSHSQSTPNANVGLETPPPRPKTEAE